jgi:hypothetical protein
VLVASLNLDLNGSMETSHMATSLLHLVFGGEVKDPRGVEFVDPAALDIVGVFPNYETALTAWRGVSQKHVDHAHIKYVIVHLHRLLEPEKDAK